MALPASFSNNTSPTGVQLDNNFAAVANMAIWNETATGTNIIALTSTANQPAVSAYIDRQRFQFIGPNNSSGSVTVAVDSLAALPLYLITGVQAASGDITSGTPYEIIYLAALNSGGGGFQIFSAVPSSSAVAQSNGLVHGLSIFNNSGTPSTKIDMTASYSVLVTTGGTPKFLSSVSVTIDLTTTGANGMDTGARPTSGWAYLYVINNGSVTAGLATATSPTAGLPTLPGGYTTFAYVGAMWLDGSQNLFRCRQKGRMAQYTVVAATNTAAYPVIASGSNSNVATASSITGVVPLTAGSIRVQLAGAASSTTSVGPTTAVNANGFASFGNPAGANLIAYIDILLETTTISYSAGAAGSGIAALGWIDFSSVG